LETLGYKDITVTWNGQEGVDAVKESWDQYLSTPTSQKFDIVLMDCLMPVMDGWTATAAIREMEESLISRASELSKEFPAYQDGVHPTIILALTANATEEDKLKCSDCGMDGFYVKPMARDALNTLMLHWVSKLFADAPSCPSSANNTPRSVSLQSPLLKKKQQQQEEEEQESGERGAGIISDPV
jgi:CheY-like chemotaxis protein